MTVSLVFPTDFGAPTRSKGGLTAITTVVFVRATIPMGRAAKPDLASQSPAASAGIDRAVALLVRIGGLGSGLRSGLSRGSRSGGGLVGGGGLVALPLIRWYIAGGRALRL